MSTCQMLRRPLPTRVTGASYTFLVCVICTQSLICSGIGTRMSSLSAAEPADQERIVETPITKYDREHWSLVPIEQPTLPTVEQASWAEEPLDYFVLARQEQAGMRPAEIAARPVLLRRLAFDVAGMPPSPAELQEFLLDRNYAAYERLVDRFLSSPSYGERWAQFWLDLARYAETDGFEHDKVRQDAWRYRDWVINALNNDMPYDQFLRLQLTGDQAADQRDAIATVFCTSGPDMPDINEQDLRRHDKLNELTSTIGAALLGMQFHCAQCHDHKYDPISQADFYRLRAIFESSIGPMIRDKPVLVLRAEPQPLVARLYHRGDLRSPGPIVHPGFPRLAVQEGEAWLCATDNPRAEFSDWLVDSENPLTARVIVNRLWQFHFGRSLCENPSDFGLIAGEPTHPELLDWLAAEMQRSRWSIKQLHRTILLSATYRQQGRHQVSSELTAEHSGAEREELYHGFPPKRLEGEVLRDALLAVSGRLNKTMAGQSVMPPLPPEMTSTLLKGQWKVSPSKADHVRRSIYTFARRNLRYPLFDVFDRPDAGTSCALRDRSTTAIQSLHMLNGDLTMECARQLSAQLIRQQQAAGGSRQELIQSLFQRTLTRTPNQEEQRWLRSHFESATTDFEAALLEACVAILNANEFLYID